MKPKRIQRQRTKGWRMPEGAIYVGRPTRWGNPFAAAGATVDEKVRAFRALFELDYKWFKQTGFCPLTAGMIFSWSLKTKADVERRLAPLRGKDLACWCALDKPCHADILLELANP